MGQLGAVLEQLKQERQRLQNELKQLNQAIRALAGVGKSTSQRGSHRVISAAARKRIAAAQKARWAKFRAKAGKKVA